MSLLSKVKHWFVGTPDSEDPKPRAEERPSRHERREAGRQRHHKTGEPAWEKSDKVGTGGGGPTKNPDAAPEIFGGG